MNAGEIGSNHSVTALYELKLRHGAWGRVGTVHIRYQNPGANSDTKSENVQTKKYWTQDQRPSRLSKRPQTTGPTQPPKHRQAAGEGMTNHHCDQRALKVAMLLHETIKPEVTILFGSRSRGDYTPGKSDIDIMLVQEEYPDSKMKSKAHLTAESLTSTLYDKPPTVQIIWKTSEEFDRKRRTVNHIIPRALRDGVIMPGNPQDYSNRYPEDNGVDYKEEWTTTDERIRHAGNHLSVFNDIVDLGHNDDMIGQQAHDAMEHALKALISVCGRSYERIHDINPLLNDAMDADPGFRPNPAIDGSVYDQYTRMKECCAKHTHISSIQGYRNIVNTEVRSILDRVQQVKQEKSS